MAAATDATFDVTIKNIDCYTLDTCYKVGDVSFCIKVFFFLLNVYSSPCTRLVMLVVVISLRSDNYSFPIRNEPTSVNADGP